jgi:hypothetical protein
VKLLKEKQQQSAGNSLWGIINRSTEPLVKNIVDSNQKFQTMKKQVDGDLNVRINPPRKQSTTTYDSQTTNRPSSPKWITCRRR